jgi:hypothetical protein
MLKAANSAEGAAESRARHQFAAENIRSFAPSSFAVSRSRSGSCRSDDGLPDVASLSFRRWGEVGRS